MSEQVVVVELRNRSMWLLGIPEQRDRSFRTIVTDDSGRT